MGKSQYLIVDDEVFIHKYMRAVFSNEAVISTACNGREALELLRNKHFDVIICDVQMPFLNGIDLFKEVKSNISKTCDKFIFCTGNVTEDFFVFCTKHEIPFCEKPIKLDVLKKIVHQVVRCNSN